MQDKLARLSKLAVAERARVMSEALLVCSEQEAQAIAPMLLQLAVRSGVEEAAPATNAKTTLAVRPSDAVTPRRADGKPDVDALRRRYGLEQPGFLAGGLGSGDADSRDARGGFVDRLRKWWNAERDTDADAALLEVVRGWSGMPTLMREAALAAGAGRWQGVVGKLNDARPSVLGNAAMLAAEAADVGLGPMVLAAARCGDAKPREVARWALFAFAVLAKREAWSEAERKNWAKAAETDELWRRMLGRGLTQGLSGDAGRVDELVMAALRDEAAADAAGEASVVIGQGRAWRELVCGDVEHVQRSLGAAMKNLRVPISRERALEWIGLGKNTVTSACSVRLARSWGVEDHAAVLGRAALVLRPARAAALARVVVRGARKSGRAGEGVDLTGTALPNAGETAAVTDATRRGAALWAMAIGADAPTRERALEPMLKQSDGVARFSVAMRGPTRLARDFAFDADARVARHAFLRACESVRDGADFDAEPATRSVHVHVAQLAKGHAERFAKPFAATTGGRLATQRLCVLDREACLKTLRWMLTRGEADEVANAVAAVRRANLVDACMDALREVAMRPATGVEVARCAASACAAMGDSLQATGAVYVRELLRHADARVRANAIEALARLARRGVRALPGEVVELKRDEHHRVRANAVREELATAAEAKHQLACVEEIAMMLADARPMHRLAGVWLASRTLVGPSRTLVWARWTEMATRVQTLATSDSDARVRLRAVACAAATAALTRASWIASAGGEVDAEVAGVA